MPIFLSFAFLAKVINWEVYDAYDWLPSHHPIAKLWRLFICNDKIPLLHEVFSIAAWEIWKQINGKIFRNLVSSFLSWKNCFLNMVKLQMYRLKHEDSLLVLDWLDSSS
jgi:hypothetical protein